jgi:DNA-binding response OmpR family regulator
MTTTEGGTVLIVDDDRGVVRTHRRYLESSYDGEAALSELDATVDVVLVDPRLPDVSGDEVLDSIRERDRDIRVAMVAAVDPDFDGLEMRFDDYITEPTSNDEIRSTVDELLSPGRHAEDVSGSHSLPAKREAPRDERSAHGLGQTDAFADLEARIESLQRTLESEARSHVDDTRFVATLRAIDDTAVKGGSDG